MSIDLGARLRTVRTRHGLSQRALAKRTGVPNSDDLAHRIERREPIRSALSSASSTASPSGCPSSSPLSPERPRKAFYRADELTEIGKGPISYRQVGDNLFGRGLQLLKERYELPGADTGRVPLVHEGEEGGIVLSGRLEVMVDDERRILGPGDAYFSRAGGRTASAASAQSPARSSAPARRRPSERPARRAPDAARSGLPRRIWYTSMDKRLGSAA